MRLSVPTGKRLSIPTGKRVSVPGTPPIDYATSYVFGLRVVQVGYVGPLIRIRRSSDDVESDFFAAVTTDIIDIAAIATFIGGGDGFIAIWYEQSGNGRDIVNVTDAEQPQFIASHNGRPALLWDGSDDVLQSTGFDLAQPLEVLWVWQTAIQVNDRFFDSADVAKRCMSFIDSAGGKIVGRSTISVSSVGDLTDADTHYMGIQFNGASSIMRYDGGVEAGPSDMGAQNMNGLTLGARFDGAFNLDGHIYEFIVSSGGILSAGQRTALEANQALFYGVP